MIVSPASAGLFFPDSPECFSLRSAEVIVLQEYHPTAKYLGRTVPQRATTLRSFSNRTSVKAMRAEASRPVHLHKTDATMSIVSCRQKHLVHFPIRCEPIRDGYQPVLTDTTKAHAF